MPIHFLVINEKDRDNINCKQYHCDYKHAVKCFIEFYLKNPIDPQIISVRHYMTYSIYNASSLCVPSTRLDILFFEDFEKHLQDKIIAFYNSYRTRMGLTDKLPIEFPLRRDGQLQSAALKHEPINTYDQGIKNRELSNMATRPYGKSKVKTKRNQNQNQSKSKTKNIHLLGVE